MHYLIFIPGDRVECLQRVGLAHLSEGAAFTSCAKGPDGGPGQIVTWPTNNRPSKAIYRPTDQEWIPAVPMNGYEAGRYHVGFWNGQPPKPQELVRPDVKHGTPIKMGDGELWLVPRAWDLPFDMVRGMSGQYERVVQLRYAEFFVAVHAWKVRFDAAADGDSFLWADLCEFVEMAIGINYRITSEVVNYLRLFQQGIGEPLLKAGMGIVSMANLPFGDSE